MIMELYRFAPNITYPDHIHEGPEFVYLLEGSARQDGKWLEAGWASSAEIGTLNSGFLSGERALSQLMSIHDLNIYKLIPNKPILSDAYAMHR